MPSKYVTTERVREVKWRSTAVLLTPVDPKQEYPCSTKASVNTMAVVVPSPASEAVRSEASFIMRTAKFSTGSTKSTALATVTPSLVTVIPCV